MSAAYASGEANKRKLVSRYSLCAGPEHVGLLEEVFPAADGPVVEMQRPLLHGGQAVAHHVLNWHVELQTRESWVAPVVVLGPQHTPAAKENKNSTQTFIRRYFTVSIQLKEAQI